MSAIARDIPGHSLCYAKCRLQQQFRLDNENKERTYEECASEPNHVSRFRVPLPVNACGPIKLDEIHPYCQIRSPSQ
ncbi:hypothetical protein VHEMI02645 [[Torrubiella] hemipterigena]|uniref:Uncharacterized protein n=1 Tax=[Torrubiella] hemipterigena TaxID=1531966 RepID=A0A0A1T8U0_9HYPO|nr:hypothetical protein VHEMI02645 [[Torrubiella] hemipterigena]